MIGAILLRSRQRIVAVVVAVLVLVLTLVLAPDRWFDRVPLDRFLQPGCFGHGSFQLVGVCLEVGAGSARRGGRSRGLST